MSQQALMSNLYLTNTTHVADMYIYRLMLSQIYRLKIDSRKSRKSAPRNLNLNLSPDLSRILDTVSPIFLDKIPARLLRVYPA